MQVTTENKERLAPFKTLSKLPSWLSDNKDMPKNATVRYVDLGSTQTFKRFMSVHTDETGNKDHSLRTDGKKFTGVDTWADYLELLEVGDEKVIKKIKADTKTQVNDIMKTYKEELNGYKFDVEGQFFDIGLVLANVPECWLEPEYAPKEQVQVELLLDGSYNCGVNKNTIIKNAARILAIAKILEDHDVQVNIKMINGMKEWDTDRYNEIMITVMTLKDYNEPINYKKLSSFITPAHFRRGIFRIMEFQSDDLAYGYGCQQNFSDMVKLHDAKTIDAIEKKLFKKDK